MALIKKGKKSLNSVKNNYQENIKKERNQWHEDRKKRKNMNNIKNERLNMDVIKGRNNKG